MVKIIFFLLFTSISQLSAVYQDSTVEVREDGIYISFDI